MILWHVHLAFYHFDVHTAFSLIFSLHAFFKTVTFSSRFILKLRCGKKKYQKGLRTSSFCKQQTRSRDPQWACTVRILRHLFTVKQLAKSLYLAYSAIGRNLRLFRVVSTYFLLSTVIQFKHTSSAYIHTFFEMALALLFCVIRSVPLSFGQWTTLGGADLSCSRFWALLYMVMWWFQRKLELGEAFYQRRRIWRRARSWSLSSKEKGLTSEITELCLQKNSIVIAKDWCAILVGFI